jgi:hypothetical protein
MFFKFRILFQSADIEILKQKNAIMAADGGDSET